MLFQTFKTKLEQQAFYLACQQGHLDVVTTLLNFGVDPKIAINNGDTSLIMASENGRNIVVELLLKHNVDPKVQNKD